jgi:hypothetical protein
MPEPSAPWDPTTAYFVAREDAGPDHDSVHSCRTLVGAQAQMDYWRRWIPGRPRVIVKAVTTYEIVEVPAAKPAQAPKPSAKRVRA